MGGKDLELLRRKVGWIGANAMRTIDSLVVYTLRYGGRKDFELPMLVMRMHSRLTCSGYRNGHHD